jgi:hypothetical protein
MEVNMRIPMGTALILMATLAPSLADSGNAVEPTAGNWKTFVIS